MIDDVFAVIADPTRRQILRVLSAGERPVGDLVEELEVSQPTVSKHLKVLRTAGLVETKAVGQKRFYSLTPAPLQKVSLWIEALGTAYEQTITSPESVEELPAEIENSSENVEEPSLETATEQAPAEPIEFLENPIEEASEETTEESSQETSHEGSFDMGDEGIAFAQGQPSHSSSAISFSPLKPFIPLSNQSLEIDAEGTEPAEEPVEIADSVEEITAETALVEDPGGEEPVEVAVPDEEPVAVDEKPVPQEQDFQELPALPSAAEEPATPEDQRGLLATLSRWGRRRSR